VDGEFVDNKIEAAITGLGIRLQKSMPSPVIAASILLSTNSPSTRRDLTVNTSFRIRPCSAINFKQLVGRCLKFMAEQGLRATILTHYCNRKHPKYEPNL
jgi:hypothetical protein